MSNSSCPRCGRPLSGLDDFCARCAGRLLLETDAEPEGAGTTPARGIGRHLGDYELGDELGRGAMGVVYRARQPRLKRDVAVKVILASRFVGESAHKRFLAEAELAAQLDHPNIVPIYEVGETPDGPFYAMKLVEGGTLADAAATQQSAAKPNSDRSTAPCRDAATLLTKLARAVHHAHERGVLHRDLKPGNILLDAQGEPHISDFGLARQLGADSSLTLTGSTLGTPAYMSPEQASGERAVTTATDVWSLGAILFHLLTGRPPFSGATATDVLLQVRSHEPPRLRALRPEIPNDLETICLKCLEKEPTRRYSSARHLAEDLERWNRHEPIEARPVSAVERITKWARRRPAFAALSALALFLFIAGAAGMAWQWRRAAAHAEESRQRLVRMTTASGLHHVEEGDFLAALPWFAEADRLETDVGVRNPKSPGAQAHRIRFATTWRQSPRLVRVWFHEGDVSEVAFSADGRRVLAASRAGNARVWDVATGQALTPILSAARTRGDPNINPDGPRVAVHAAFSPDGDRVAAAAYDGAARVWNVSNGTALTPLLAHGQGWLTMNFSPDGGRVATAAGGVAKQWNAFSGQQIGSDLNHGDTWIYHVAYSPDGSRLLTAGFYDHKVMVWEAASGKRLGEGFTHGEDIRHAAFSPDGGRILIAGVNARIYDLKTGNCVGPFHDTGVYYAAFNPEGTRVVTCGVDAIARVWNAATGQPVTPPLHHTEAVRRAEFSPDGRWVITASEDHTARIWDTTKGTLAFPPLWHGNGVERAGFSPDGGFVLTGSLDGVVRLWDLRQSAGEVVLLNGQTKLGGAWFDATGERVLTVTASNLVEVWDARNGAALGPAFSATASGKCASWASDGKMAAVGFEDGNMVVREIASGDSLGTGRHGGDVRFVAWRSDNRAVLFGGGGDYYIQFWHGDSPTTLLEPHEVTHHAAFSPDGGMVALCGAGGATVWDSTTLKPRTSRLTHGGGLLRVTFSPDGRRLATTSNNGTAVVWDATTGAQVTPPLRHGGWVTETAFSPDSRRLMTASDDGTARIWEVATGRALTPPLVLRGGVVHPAFTRDGRLVRADNGYFLQVWDSASGTPVTPPLNPQSPILDSAFSRDERRVLAVTSDRRVISWDINPVDWPLEDISAAARLLSCHEVDATGAAVPIEQILESDIRQGGWAITGTASTNRSEAALQESETGPTKARALLSRDWNRVKSRLAPESPPGESQVQIRWHAEQAAIAEVNQEWFAAAFHLDRLSVLCPGDGAVRERLEAARLRATKPQP